MNFRRHIFFMRVDIQGFQGFFKHQMPDKQTPIIFFRVEKAFCGFQIMRRAVKPILHIFFFCHAIFPLGNEFRGIFQHSIFFVTACEQICQANSRSTRRADFFMSPSSFIDRIRPHKINGEKSGILFGRYVRYLGSIQHCESKRMAKFSFSGHEKFHCRQFWLKKGYDFLCAGRRFTDEDAVVALGVGKNMVNSIRFWLKAFGLVDEREQPNEFARFIFGEQGCDPY